MLSVIPLIGAGLSTLGTLISGKSAQKSSEQSSQNMVEAARIAAEKNAQLQREFAQHGIRWRVADARAAGLHPLAALGMSGASATPVYTAEAKQEFASPLGEALQAGGQSLSRMAVRPDQQDAREKMLSLENMGLNNELLRTRIASERQQMQQAADPVVRSWAQEGGPGIPSLGFERTPTGGLSPIPGADIKQRIEDMPIQEGLWTVRNYLAANFGSPAVKPPKDLLAHFNFPGLRPYDDWKWSTSTQDWQPTWSNRSTWPGGMSPAESESRSRQRRYLGR